MARITGAMVIEEVKKAAEKGITASEIAEATGWGLKTIQNHLGKILKWKVCPIRFERKGHEYLYFFETPTVEGEKEEPTTNAEGYKDPTARDAIRNFCKNPEKFNGFESGRIYKSTNNGDFLVVRPYKGDTVLGYNIETSRIIESNNDSEVSWVGDNGVILRVKCNRLTSVAYKKLNVKNGYKCPDDKFVDIIAKSPLYACRVVVIEGPTIEKKVVSQEAINLEVNKAIGDCATQLNAALDITGSVMNVRKSFEYAVNCVATLVSNYSDLENEHNLQNEAWAQKHKDLKEAFDALMRQYHELTGQYRKALDRIAGVVDADEGLTLDEVIDQVVIAVDYAHRSDTDAVRAEIYEKVYRDLVEVLKGGVK